MNNKINNKNWELYRRYCTGNSHVTLQHVVALWLPLCTCMSNLLVRIKGGDFPNSFSTKPLIFLSPKYHYKHPKGKNRHPKVIARWISLRTFESYL